LAGVAARLAWVAGHIGHRGGLVTRLGGAIVAVGSRAGATTLIAGWSPRAAWLRLREVFGAALESEIAQRRPFLWLPVASGAGVALYFAADREPSLGFAAFIAATAAGLCICLRRSPGPLAAALAFAALAAGFTSASLRSWLLAAPVIDRVHVLKLSGTVEQLDRRRIGARMVLRVSEAQGLRPEETPYRLRLTTREAPRIEAGAFVRLTARVLPPARPALPNGYDFGREAFFARLGGVGSVLGHIAVAAPPTPPGPWLRLTTAVDRARNVLAQRVFTIIGGDEGAVAAAMVTGKRDLLSDKARELIREAGIFHIITISGVQMTLVAGMIFWVLRGLLALSATLALRYPIKKWAAGAAMVGAVAYDIATGSRVGTERALFMTLIVFAAIIVDRRAFTMRNLAYAAFAVIAFEPESILGASFQLSFAAVSALIAVSEARLAAISRDWAQGKAREPPPQGLVARLARGLGWLLFATLCATSATASFMAYDFHELSPYVLIGNPLTLTIIEFFAVPGALVGALLYPLGLDAFVWHYVGAGIQLIFWAARFIAAAPGATLYLRAFAPWSIGFLTLAVLSAVIWRTLPMRLTALIFLALGLVGAMSGEGFDVAVAPAGDTAAVRLSDGRLVAIGSRQNPFDIEQWLRTDGDGREPRELLGQGGSCDQLGCVARLADGSALALVLDVAAFEEDCLRADIIVSPLNAPSTCGTPLILDRGSLAQTGAVTLRLANSGFVASAVRAIDEDRPWSRPPKPAPLSTSSDEADDQPARAEPAKFEDAE
jgi:competence protein ComEC